VPENSSSFLTPSATLTLPYFLGRRSGMVRKHQTRNLEIPGSLRAPE
jgi:hypothetical protein